MWLATQHGFYYIICKSAREFHILGRCREDLENLLLLTGKNLPIHDHPLEDFRYHITSSRETFVEIMARLALALDYPRFTGLHSNPAGERNRMESFHRICTLLEKIQEQADANPNPETPGRGSGFR
ncbi:MAG: hypothetical protein R6V45_01365 [Oceanipulchritudo sp.]